MSFTNTKDYVYGSVRDPENSSPFGCLDCLLIDNTEAQAFPLYLYEGTNLCANHVRLRIDKQTDTDKLNSETKLAGPKPFTGLTDARFHQNSADLRPGDLIVGHNIQKEQ